MSGVTLLPDPVWTDRFERERDRILDALATEPTGVFHVGSTAIAGVPGKPMLDVLLVVPTDRIDRAADRLAAGDYDRAGEDGDAVILLREPGDWLVSVRTYPPDDDVVRSQLLFRELLRDDPDARCEYAAVKREAAAEHDDRIAYTDAKEPVVRSLTERADREGYDDDLPAFV